jgi:hypothetical protein
MIKVSCKLEFKAKFDRNQGEIFGQPAAFLEWQASSYQGNFGKYRVLITSL